MCDIPDDVCGADLLEAEFFAHTRALAATLEYLEILGVDAATARADYMAARARGYRAHEEAAAAVERWSWVNRKAAVVLDELRSIQRAVDARALGRATVLVTGPEAS